MLDSSPAAKFSRPGRDQALLPRLDRLARAAVVCGLACGLVCLFAVPAGAFCGFYVAKADTGLFNSASKVVIARDGDRTVVTMANDFRGEPEEFAIVIPVPTKLERGQIHVGDRAVIDHLDAYTAPRLVEYFDDNPCQMELYDKDAALLSVRAEAAPAAEQRKQSAKSLGVTIEAEYTVGEYDIVILSAKESEGLETWLRQEGYRLPKGASPVLGSYLKQDMRFFVAKVNLEQQAKLGYSYLRPLQVAYETPKFMLPIRLGTLNADGAQELFVWLLSRTGRIETSNYRTVRLATDAEVPEFVEQEFGDFYRDLFAHQVEQERGKAVFLEYAWDMAWCDPCAADPLSPDELRQLGVFWQADPDPRRQGMAQGAPNVFVSRLHVRYTADTFPEDLVFQETGDRSNFQGRFVIRHPWQGSPRACAAAASYFETLATRQRQEAKTLANLTGWDLETIHGKMKLSPAQSTAEESSWWDRLWGG